MVVHFVNSALVGDGELDVEHPEAVIYEPQNGVFRLVGVGLSNFHDRKKSVRLGDGARRAGLDLACRPRYGISVSNAAFWICARWPIFILLFRAR